MEIRQATAEEIASFRAMDDFSHVAVEEGHTWVAVENGKVIGALPLELCWRAEPLLIFESDAPRITRSRAALLMYLAVEEFIKKTPANLPKWLFATSHYDHVNEWSARLGWRRIYEASAMFVKHLAS